MSVKWLPDDDATPEEWFHWSATVFFGAQVPVSLAAYYLTPGIFEAIWKPYLVFLSLWALVSTHIGAYLAAGAKAAAKKVTQ